MYLQYYFHALHCFVPLKCQILSDLNVMFLLWWAASAGLGFLQFCNLNSYRSMFIVGFSLFIGLSVPQYFQEYLTLSGHGPAHTGSTSVHIYLTRQVSSCYKYSHLWFLFWFSGNMQFNNIVQVIFSSPATVAIIVAYFLDATMSREHASTHRDSGRHWWEKFRTFNQDIRSDEFYGLPMNLNRFFPSA